MLENFRTYTIAKEFYSDVKDLEVDAYLRGQLVRASSSIVLNLAEGSGRATPRDRRRFYQIAYGSFKETESILEINGHLTEERKELTNKLGAHLYKLLKYFEYPQAS